MMAVTVREMVRGDWDVVRAIYAAGIATGLATLETEVPSWEIWDARHRSDGRFVAVTDETVIGWAALVPVSPREVYRGVAEVSVYVAPEVHGRGVGTMLLEHLVRASEAAGIWTLQAGIFPENTVSIAMHRRAGFRVVGRRERIGCRDGRWRDVMLLERRSAVVGRDP